MLGLAVILDQNSVTLSVMWLIKMLVRCLYINRVTIDHFMFSVLDVGVYDMECGCAEQGWQPRWLALIFTKNLGNWIRFSSYLVHTIFSVLFRSEIWMTGF